MSLRVIAETYCPLMAKPLLNRMKASPVARKVASGTFWSIVGTGTAKAFSLLALVLTARILGTELNGEFGFIRSTAMSFVTFSCFGIGVTATKNIAEFFRTDKEKTGRIIGLCYGFSFISSLIVTIAFFFAVPWLCTSQLNMPHLVTEMRLGAFLLFLITFMSTQTGVMTGFQDFRGLAATNCLAGVAAVPLYAGGAYCWGLRGALCGLLGATLLNLVLNSIFIFRNTKKYAMRYSFNGAWREIPLLWQYGLPTLVCAVLFSFSTWACQLMLAAQPGGSGELGIYYAAMIFYPVILFLPEQVASVFLPLLTELHAQGDTARYRKVVIRFLFFGLLSTLALALPFALFSRQIMSLCGAEFESGSMTLVIIAATAVVFILAHAANIVVVSCGKMWFMAVYFAVGITAMLLVSVTLIHSGWGAYGLALGMLFGFFARLLVIGGYGLLHRHAIALSYKIN